MAVGYWPGGPGTDIWDDLRKQARKLESELDQKLVSYRRISSAPQDVEAGNEFLIKELLQQLHDVNSKMQDWVSSAGSHVLSHTLARHKDILQELRQEFARINSRAKVNRDHTALLETFRGTPDRKNVHDNGEDSSEQALLREQSSVHRANGQMDSVIGQAQAALSALTSQRTVFSDISGKIGAVGTKIPAVNHLLAAIRRKKSKDTIILGLVSSICTVLILLYWLTK